MKHPVTQPVGACYAREVRDRVGICYDRRVLDDGRELLVTPLTFQRALLSIGPNGQRCYDDAW